MNQIPRTKNYKLLVILGPTASGKSDLAVKIAKKFNGEVISADSRQVYKGMNIGTGKVPRDKISNFQFLISKQIPKFKNLKQAYFYKGIQHHLLNIISPKSKFSVAQYRRLALAAINNIFKKGKIPILCGGTGFYIQAVVNGVLIPEVKPDWNLRKKLEKKSVKELYKILKKLDLRRAKNIDKNNPRRLIRAIEIVMKTKKPVPSFKKNPLPYPVLMIGIKKSKRELDKLIEKRFFSWLKKGLFAEVNNLRKSGLSWKKIEDFGIHYRVTAQYLQKKISRQEMIDNSLKELRNYAKRQMTWFSAHGGSASSGQHVVRIHWIKNQKETPKKSLRDLTGQAEKLVREFL